MKPITLVSSVSNHIDYAASAIFGSVDIPTQRAHLKDHSYVPDSLTLTTLGSLGLTHHHNFSIPLSESIVESSQLIATDDQTRSQVHAKFGVLAPLLSEVLYNKTQDLVAEDKVTTIHLIDNHKNILTKRLSLFENF